MNFSFISKSLDQTETVRPFKLYDWISLKLKIFKNTLKQSAKNDP